MNDETSVILCPYCAFPVVTESSMAYCLCLACHCRLTTNSNNEFEYAIFYHQEDDCWFQLVFKNNKTIISGKHKDMPNELFDNILTLDFFLEKPNAPKIFDKLKHKMKKLVIFL